MTMRFEASPVLIAIPSAVEKIEATLFRSTERSFHALLG
jgi:hypothetical protein